MTNPCDIYSSCNRANKNANLFFLSDLRCLVNKQRLLIDNSKLDDSKINNF